MKPDGSEVKQLSAVEKELVAAHDMLAVTLASIGDGVIATDLDGRVTFLNAEAERLTGWRSAEALGKPLPEIFRIFNAQTRQPAENPVEQVLRLGTRINLANHTVLISKNGAETAIEDSAAPIRHPGAAASGVVLVFRDASEQRRAQEVRARLAAIVQFSGDAILTKNLEGILQTWNESAERLFGYTAKEAIGKPVTMLFPADRLKEEDEILGRLRQGQPSERLETVRVAKDGRHIPVSLSVSPIKDAQGTVIGASKIIHDISDLVAAREALVREKELLGTTLASIGDAVIVTDAEGRVTFLNAEAERLTAWTQAEAAGHPLEEMFRIVNAQTREPVEDPVGKVLRHGGVVGLANHTVLLARDGREIPIDDSAAPIQRPGGPLFGIVLIFRDATEPRRLESRRLARAAITEILAEAETVQDAAPRILRAVCEALGWDCGAVWRVDEQSQVLRCLEVWAEPNVQVSEFQATTRRQAFAPGAGLPGRIWAGRKSLWIPDVTKETNFPRARVAEREGVRSAFGFPLMIGAEFLGVVEFFSREIRQPDADLLEMTTTIGSQVGQFMGRKQAEEWLREGEDQLREAHAQLASRAQDLERLVQERTRNLREMIDELRHLSYAITHDMRAPLRAMSNFASAVLEEVASNQLSPQVQDYCRRIIAASARLDKLIQDSLNYTAAVLRETPLQPVDLSKLLPSLVETYPNLQPDKADIAFADALPIVLGEESLLTQCFSNLLGNAVKFVPQGVRPRVLIRASNSNGASRIIIEDNGIGIPLHAQQRLFGMFQRLTANYEGTGIGLAIVRKVVERMGGKVGADSEPGKGSRFWVELRLAQTDHGTKRLQDHGTTHGTTGPQDHGTTGLRAEEILKA